MVSVGSDFTGHSWLSTNYQVMKNLRTVMILCILSPFSSIACDICGNYMGITPYDNKSSISFLHRYRIFNGYRDYQHQSRFFPASAYKVMHGDLPHDTNEVRNYSSKDFESYKVFELRFKYFLVKRWEVNVFLPVLDNRSKTDDVFLHHTGFGDISFNTAYHVITPKSGKSFRHKLIIGVGIKIPTGNFYAHDAHSDRLPFEMQPGTGSTDGFAYMNYVMLLKNWGINTNLSYKANGKNSYREHLGNSHNDFMSLFYKLTAKAWQFYPSVQANYEFTKGLYVNHVLIGGTNFNSLMVGPGLDVYYKSFSVNASWQFTVMEQITPGDLKGAGRINIGLNYSFNRREKGERKTED